MTKVTNATPLRRANDTSKRSKRDALKYFRCFITMIGEGFNPSTRIFVDGQRKQAKISKNMKARTPRSHQYSARGKADKGSKNTYEKFVPLVVTRRPLSGVQCSFVWIPHKSIGEGQTIINLEWILRSQFGMDQTEKGEGHITLPKLSRPGAEKLRRIDIPKKEK